jgi:cytochrome c2
LRLSALNRTSQAVGATILIIVAGASYLRSEIRVLPADSRGATLFREQGCSHCHHAGRTDEKIGPGLAGVLDARTLPASGRPATRENIRAQLTDPYDAMPSFADSLDQGEVEAIIDYLEKL